MDEVIPYDASIKLAEPKDLDKVWDIMVENLNKLTEFHILVYIRYMREVAKIHGYEKTAKHSFFTKKPC